MSLDPRAIGTIALVVMVLAVSFAPLAHAELPKDAYLRMQREAPEFVHIEIVGVQKISRNRPECKYDEIVLTAVVKRVERTSVGLKAGTCIRIAYWHHTGVPMPGMSEVPILKCGQVYPAFLERCEKSVTFRPAARGYSFDAIRDEGKKT